MLPHDGLSSSTGRGDDGFSLKEKVIEINESVKKGFETLGTRLDVIERNLERKADNERVQDLHSSMVLAENRNVEARAQLDTRISLLEASTVKREGPIIDRFQRFEERQLEFEVEVGKEIDRKIVENDKLRTEDDERVFSRRDRIWIGALACVSSLCALVSTAAVVLRYTHG